jgi:hypothetical protein
MRAGYDTSLRNTTTCGERSSSLPKPFRWRVAEKHQHPHLGPGVVGPGYVARSYSRRGGNRRRAAPGAMPVVVHGYVVHSYQQHWLRGRCRDKRQEMLKRFFSPSPDACSHSFLIKGLQRE